MTSGGGKARTTPTQVDFIKNLSTDRKKLYGEIRKRASGVSSQSQVGGNSSRFSTGSTPGVNLLISNNIWTGDNTFEGPVFSVTSKIIVLGDGTGTIDFFNPAGSDLDMNNNFIHNVRTPVSCGDAVNKCYVDNAIIAVTTLNGLLVPGGANELLSESAFVTLVGMFDTTPVGEGIGETAFITLTGMFDTTPVGENITEMNETQAYSYSLSPSSGGGAGPIQFFGDNGIMGAGATVKLFFNGIDTTFSFLANAFGGLTGTPGGQDTDVPTFALGTYTVTLQDNVLGDPPIFWGSFTITYGMNPGTGHAGDTLNYDAIAGALVPGTGYDLYFNGTIIKSVVADPSLGFSQTATVPALSPGTYPVKIIVNPGTIIYQLGNYIIT